MSGTNPSYSTDLKLPAYPTSVDEKKDPGIYGDLTLVHQAIRTVQSYLDNYTASRSIGRAVVAISVGQFVAASASYSDVCGLILADNTTHTKQCIGFATQSEAAGIPIEFQSIGIWPYGNGALVPGTVYYLGTAGAITATVPTGAGKTVQIVGIALDTSNLLFRPSLRYVEL